MSEASKREHQYEGIPTERINELHKEGSGYTQFKLRISRRGDGGHIQFLKNIMVTVAELMDIGSLLSDYSGGGRYFIQAFDPQMPTKRLFDFHTEVVGPPKVPLDKQAMHPVDSSGIAAPVPGSAASQLFAQPTPPEHGAPFGPPVGFRYGTPVATHTSDQIALDQLREARDAQRKLEETLRAMQEEREKDRVAAAARLEQERQERQREEKEAMARAHAAELKRLEDLIKANNDKPKGPNWWEMLPAMAPFVPVLTALVASKSSTEALAIERQNAMIKTQMDGVNALMQATVGAKSDSAKGLMETVKVLGPIVAPMLATYMANNGPKAQAELLEVQSNNQMTQMQMIAQLIEQSKQGDPENPYIQLAERAFEGLVAVGQAMAKQQAKPGVGQQMLQGVTQQLTGGQPPQQQATEGPTPGEQIANQVLSNPACPADMRTQEWFSILASVHDKDPVDDVATNLATHIGNLDIQKKLPKVLESIFDADKPEDVLVRVFSVLPIWQTDIIYAKQVIAKTVEILSTPDTDEGEEEAAE